MHYLQLTRRGSRMLCLGLAVGLVAAFAVSSAPPAGQAAGLTPDARAAMDAASALSGPTPLEMLDQMAQRAPEAKIASSLAKIVAGTVADDQMVVVVRSPGALDLSAFSKHVHQFTWPAGEHISLLKVHVSDIARLAAVPGVARVESGELDPSRRPPLMGRTGGGAGTDRPTLVTGAPLASVLKNLADRRQSGTDLKTSKTAVAPSLTDSQSPELPGLIDGQERKVNRSAGSKDGKGAQSGKVAGADGVDALTNLDGLSGWWDVGNGHAVAEAWGMGFQGQGVRAAVLDTGMDFAHPDLQGTWAVFPPGHPDAGWPQVFDPMSAYQWVLDQKVDLEKHMTRQASGTMIEMYQIADVDQATIDGKEQFVACLTPLVGMSNGSRVKGTEDCDYIVPESKSQSVRYGHHPDGNLATIKYDAAKQIAGEYAGVLLVDSKTAGVYDTVYVDTNLNHDFTDEKPATMSDPVIYKDVDNDDIADLSGGLLYYIADGTRPAPGSHLFGMEKNIPGPYTYVGLFIDSAEHGTLCTSAVVSQGRLGVPPSKRDGMVFRNLPSGGLPEGLNPGMAPKASFVGIGNVYDADIVFDAAWRYAVMGEDPNLDTDNVQVASNSYGFSDQDNDSWDSASRSIDYYVRKYSPSTTFLVATGNGGPGYGTITPPKPMTGMGIGSSTQFGAGSPTVVGRMSITDTSQITYGDLIPFSNRGPGANGQPGPQVAANGSYGWGAEPINLGSVAAVRANPTNPTGNGLEALGVWAGTSRSTPVATGALALVYQAFKSANNRWPTWLEARALLMGGARYAGYDTFAMGAGVVDAADSARIASGRHGIYAMPPQWIAGGYHGQSYPGFASVLTAGQTAKQTVTIKNPSDHAIAVTVAGQTLRRIGSVTEKQTSTLAVESAFHGAIPDYLMKLDKSKIPVGTELMIVRSVLPLSKSDTPFDSNPYLDNSFFVKVLQHTDINGDGILWNDANANGVVNHQRLVVNNVSTAAVDWSKTEMEQWEFEELNENTGEMNNKDVYVHHPLERWKDGLYLAWFHPNRCNNQGQCFGRTTRVANSEINVQIDFYAYQDWPWLKVSQKSLNVPAKGEVMVDATLAVPAGTGAGAYEGAIFADYARGQNDNPVPTGGAYELPIHRLVIPVNANVVANYDWKGAVYLGGAAADDPNAPYSNSVMRGAADRTWRPETGDWRFFFLDTPAPAPGTFWMSRTDWSDGSKEKSDIDWSLFGQSKDRFSDPMHQDNISDTNRSDPDWYGPYTMAPIARSASPYVGGGTWQFSTSSGGNEDWISGPASEGLAEVILHNVLFGGAMPGLPFTTTVSSVQLTPPLIELAGNECGTLKITPQMDLPGVKIRGIGLSAPEKLYDQPIMQDDVNDPSTASYQKDVELTSEGARFNVTLKGGADDDLDLYVLYDANMDGQFAFPGEVVAVSSSTTANEAVSLTNFQKAGNYQIWVHGFKVTGGKGKFDMTVDIISGDQLSVMNAPINAIAGQTIEVKICPNNPPTDAGPFNGVVVLGPGASPGAISVPVVWTKKAKSQNIYLPAALRDFAWAGYEAP